MYGLERADQVYLNRLQRDYAKDDLPHPEQIRADIGRLMWMLGRLDAEIVQMRKQVKW